MNLRSKRVRAHNVWASLLKAWVMCLIQKAQAQKWLPTVCTGPKGCKGQFTAKLNKNDIKCNSALKQCLLKEALLSFLRLG